jgi:di/tricarboxylate transporter
LLFHLTPQQLALFAILVLSFVVLLTERIRNDIVALLIVLGLYLTGILNPNEALSGFSSGPAIIVAAMFVLGAGLHQTGLDETIGRWIGRMAGKSYNRALAVIMPLVALLAAFTNDVATTAVMLPVTLNLARQNNLPASKVLMPVSFAASLGTTITIIGAPALLIASSILQSSGRPPLGIFSMAPIGLGISLVGTIFMLTVGRLLLPSREGKEDPMTRFRLDEYFTEVTIPPDSPLVGKTLQELESNGWHDLTVVGWVRNRRPLRQPFGERQLSAGDVLLVRTTPEEIVTLRQESGIQLKPVEEYGMQPADGNGKVDDVVEQLAQVVVAPASDLVGRTIGRIDFRDRYGAILVGIWRRGFLDKELAKTKLRAGDILVLQGEEDALNRAANDPSFLVMIPFQGEGRFRRKAPLASAIMLITILGAALNVVTLEMATLAGAVAMVVMRCLTTRQAYRAIDYRIYVFIAGAVPLGIAMEKTGTAEIVAGWLQSVMVGWNQTFVLLALFGAVSVVTQFMDDAAATAIFVPVAIALARAFHQLPEAYVVTVAVAAVAALLTPIGHNGNLLVYGPGRYQFSDFVKVGTPLTLLVALVVAFLAPLIWAH